MMRRASRAALSVILALVACQDSTSPMVVRGTRILFERDDGRGISIYEIAPDGTGLNNLTRSQGSRDLHPSWSPDGRRIAFVSDRTPAGLYVMNADGSGMQALTKADPVEAYPAWSPDGSRIAVVSSRGGEYDIWVVASDGSNPVQITSFGAEAPAWTPDGKGIAYTDLSVGAIGLVILNGKQRYQITFPPTGGVDEAPAWAPDGSALAFVRATDSTTRHLYVLAAGDTVPKAITDFPVGSDWTPAWAPTGHQLVFAHDVNDDYDLYTIAEDGGGIQPLTGGPGLDFRPSW